VRKVTAHSDTGLGLLGWTDLGDEVTRRRAAATASGAPHWDRVLDLVRTRVDVGRPDLAPPLQARRWWLTTVRISGFRGT
jgi:hypothetical protein